MEAEEGSKMKKGWRIKKEGTLRWTIDDIY